MAAKKKLIKTKQKAKRKKAKVSKVSNHTKKRVKELQLKLEAALAKQIVEPIQKQEACTSTKDFNPDTFVKKEYIVSPSEYESIVAAFNSPKINNRHKILSLIHNHMVGLEVRFQKEIFDLEDRYLRQYYGPLQALRKALIEADANGKQSYQYERTLVENCKSSFNNDFQKFTELQLRAERLLLSGYGETSKKCQEFWLVVLLHSDPLLRNMIQPRDIEILRYLTDVKTEPVRLKAQKQYPPDRELEENSDVAVGYDIVFEFRPNPFFSNSHLTKRYLIDVVPDQCDYVIAPHSDVLIAQWHNEKSTKWKDKYPCNSMLCDAILNKDHSLDKLLDYNGPQVIAIQGCLIRWTSPYGDIEFGLTKNTNDMLTDESIHSPEIWRPKVKKEFSFDSSLFEKHTSPTSDLPGFTLKPAPLASAQVLKQESRLKIPFSKKYIANESLSVLKQPSSVMNALENQSFLSIFENQNSSFGAIHNNNHETKDAADSQCLNFQEMNSFSQHQSSPFSKFKALGEKSFNSQTPNTQVCSNNWEKNETSSDICETNLPLCSAIPSFKRKKYFHQSNSKTTFFKKFRMPKNTKFFSSEEESDFLLSKQFPYPRANNTFLRVTRGINSLSTTSLESFMQASATLEPLKETESTTSSAQNSVSTEEFFSKKPKEKSFFNFFEMSWNEKSPDHCKEVARDYQIGAYIRDVLIPRAYLFYRRKDLSDQERECQDSHVITSLGNRYEREFRSLNASASPPKSYDEIDDDIPAAISNQALKTIESCASFKKEIIDNNKETAARIANSFIGKMIRRRDDVANDVDNDVCLQTKKCRSSTFENKIDVDDVIVTTSTSLNETNSSLFQPKPSELSTMCDSVSNRSLSDIYEADDHKQSTNSGSSVDLTNNIPMIEFKWIDRDEINKADSQNIVDNKEEEEENEMNFDPFEKIEEPDQRKTHLTIFSGYKLSELEKEIDQPEVGDNTEEKEKPEPEINSLDDTNLEISEVPNDDTLDLTTTPIVSPSQDQSNDIPSNALQIMEEEYAPESAIQSSDVAMTSSKEDQKNNLNTDVTEMVLQNDVNMTEDQPSEITADETTMPYN